MCAKVLVTVTNFKQHCANAREKLLENGIELIENDCGRPMTFDELKPILGQVDGVIAGIDTWDEAVFQVAPKLRCIARFGVGVDNIDLVAAGKHGVKVCNARGINSVSVAEHAMALMLCAYRDIPNLNESTREGQWTRFMGRELRNKMVGLLGFGMIAKEVAIRLRAFGANVIAYDLYPDYDAAKEIGVYLADINTVLQQSDILSIHLPANEQTRHIINAQSISSLKDGAYLINTSRGALIDEAALYDALTSGKIHTACLDVYESEPAQSSNPLFKLKNVICTPHSAGETSEVYAATGDLCANAILTELCGGKLQNWLNEGYMK